MFTKYYVLLQYYQFLEKFILLFAFEILHFMYGKFFQSANKYFLS